MVKMSIFDKTDLGFELVFLFTSLTNWR